MCGIAGILSASAASAPDAEELLRMIAVLRHRGPDGYGLYRDAFVALGHARLSIVDLSGGAQPMSNEDGSLWVTFNGEIFNHVELRAELEQFGHRFQTRCDTEIIVHAYEQWGQDAWLRFNGQFAFALWDAQRRRLWLVRDRLGILPLYYARVDARMFFASEPKALFAAGPISPRLDAAGVVQAFTRWSATAPRTVFEGVASVQPAGVVGFDDALRPSERIYWRPDFSVDPAWESRSLDQAADALEEKLSRAVALRLRADVPVGAYLSGGLDSSVVGDRMRARQPDEFRTFSVRFTDPVFDETGPQRLMAGLLGTQHHEILCDDQQLVQALPDLIWHCEAPLLRTAPAPLFLLSGLVQATGRKVVLTGEGADELLAGYDIFKEDRIRRFWARRPESQIRPRLLSRLYADVRSASQRDSAIWRQFFAQGMADLSDPLYSHRVRWSNMAWSLRLLDPDWIGAFSSDELDARLSESLPPSFGAWSPLSRAQMLEISTFLSPYLLSFQGDRVAMAHGVEVRYPFLDPEVVDFCCRLPGRFRLRGLLDKVVLRRVASRRLPEDIWRRPKKPYRAPLASPFFAGTSPGYVDDLLSESALRRSGVVNVPVAGRLVEKARRLGGRMSGEREEMALVGLLTLQLLLEQHSGGLSTRVTSALRALLRRPPNVDAYSKTFASGWPRRREASGASAFETSTHA